MRSASLLLTLAVISLYILISIVTHKLSRRIAELFSEYLSEYLNERYIVASHSAFFVRPFVSCICHFMRYFCTFVHMYVCMRMTSLLYLYRDYYLYDKGFVSFRCNAYTRRKQLRSR